MKNNEDIKILENLKENVALFSGGWQPILKQEEKQAIENLINRNKELEEENKIYKNIKHLMDNEILGYMEGYRAGRDGITGIAKVGENYEKYILNIRLNQYKQSYIKVRELLDDSIPKTKIKEKIEELEMKSKKETLSVSFWVIQSKIRVLQELLEE